MIQSVQTWFRDTLGYARNGEVLGLKVSLNVTGSVNTAWVRTLSTFSYQSVIILMIVHLQLLMDRRIQNSTVPKSLIFYFNHCMR